MKYIPKHPDEPLPAHYAVKKADGDGPVQDWIALLPGWQAERARQIDALVSRELPTARKAVKWHGAWYGMPGQGWFLALNTFKAHLKLTFFDGCSLDPVPPDALAHRPASALNVKESATLDEMLISRWIAQASRLPGLFKA